jgi:DNA-binding MarR family transcriptional regulator
MDDSVDRLVAAWQRVLPHVDVEPLEVLSRVSRLARHLELARREAFGQPGLAEWQFDVLAALRRAGPPYEMTPGGLLAETLVSSGTMTHRIDLMEKAGLVRRGADPRDGRQVLVRLTDAGLAAVDTALESLLARERTLLATLGSAERAQLASLLKEVLVPFEVRPA